MALSGFLELAQYYPFLIKGVYWTLLISAVAILGGSVVGVAVALLRTAGSRSLRALGTLYVDFFRSTPFLVQLVWFYYAFPVLIGVSLTEIQAGLIGIVLYSAAYLAEVFRAGILSVERGQREAALAIGMKPVQVMIRIVLPQAAIRMLPAIANIFISKVKDSSVVSVIGVTELLRQASITGEFSGLRMQALTIAALLYFCITLPLSQGADWLHRRFSGEYSAKRSSGPQTSLVPG